MQKLLPLAEEVGKLLQARKQKIAVAESAAGGLINAALLAVPGASGWCLGGAVLYTRQSRLALKGMHESMFEGMTGSTEAYAMFMARAVRERFDAQWCLCETGTAGPTGSRYGYAAGHACFAVAGPVEQTLTIETGKDDRVSNMYAFAETGLIVVLKALKLGTPTT
jgi:nicotinamide-nucleotide amidase